MKVRSIRWLLCAGLVAAGCASSSGSRHASGNPDEYFMVWASQVNLAEIATGEMAAQRAVNGEVRRYGEEMVQAHREANQELQRLAEKNGVSLASRPDEAHAQFSEHLAKLEGEAFDREYIGSMVANHAKTLAMFEERARSASDPELRTWARQMVPVLEEHLEQARTIQEELERIEPASAPQRIVPP
jgi:putative membrane protein